ncbi:acyl-CoA N-acyltransferase, partial [Myriangium duriaei CBS 260.36]
LHPNLSFGPITQANLPHLKRINALLLPIPYPTSFYSEIIADPTTASISLAAIWTDGPNPPKLIGGIRCRLLSPDAPTPNTAALTTAFTSIARARRQGPEERMLYISSLTLLSPFRGLGVAKELLRRVEAVARERYGVQTVGAHTWIANEEGRRWYATRGFEEVRIEEGYYRRLEPQAAVVLVKK